MLLSFSQAQSLRTSTAETLMGFLILNNSLTPPAQMNSQDKSLIGKREYDNMFEIQHVLNYFYVKLFYNWYFFIKNRDFWTDGTGVSSFFVMYERYIQSVQQTNQSSSLNNANILRGIMQRLTSDWNLTRMRDLLLWDKLNKTDVYGVGNDDRLWYAIAFL